MNNPQTYIIDSDVFISAKNRYYAFDICPGFWDSLIHHHNISNIHSIDKVKTELLTGAKTEDLVQWVKKDIPGGFFLSTNDESVLSAYAEIMLWVQRNPQYQNRAKAKFATEADGWLVAYAMTHKVTIATNEQSRPESKNRILLPDVCTKFNVTFKDTFFMLKDLSVRYEWKKQFDELF